MNDHGPELRKCLNLIFTKYEVSHTLILNAKSRGLQVFKSSHYYIIEKLNRQIMRHTAKPPNRL